MNTKLELYSGLIAIAKISDNCKDVFSMNVQFFGNKAKKSPSTDVTTISDNSSSVLGLKATDGAKSSSRTKRHPIPYNEIVI